MAVTVDEVKKAVQLLENNRDPGICKITSEMLKAGGDIIIRWLRHIINEVWYSKNLRGLDAWNHVTISEKVTSWSEAITEV